MANYRENYRDEASPFYITEAILSSERLPEGTSIDVSRVLTDLDIFEDINNYEVIDFFTKHYILKKTKDGKVYEDKNIPCSKM